MKLSFNAGNGVGLESLAATAPQFGFLRRGSSLFASPQSAQGDAGDAPSTSTSSPRPPPPQDDNAPLAAADDENHDDVDEKLNLVVRAFQDELEGAQAALRERSAELLTVQRELLHAQASISQLQQVELGVDAMTLASLSTSLNLTANLMLTRHRLTTQTTTHSPWPSPMFSLPSRPPTMDTPVIHAVS